MREKQITDNIFNGLESVKILDAGRNMGALLESFPKSWDKIGIDLSPKSLDIGHNKTCNLDFVLCDASHLALVGEVADLAICSEVPEHIIELGPAMDEVDQSIDPANVLPNRVGYVARKKLK